MKRIFYFLLGVLILTGMMQIYSCRKQNDDNPRPIYKDTKKPERVTNVHVENFPGGAKVIYDVPADPAILYVEADYMINGHDSLQGKASYYTDTLVLKGFAASADYKVALRTVSRSEVKSDPVIITVHPDTPPYLFVKSSLKIFGDFGGANIAFENPSDGELAIVALVDSSGKANEVYTNYTKDPGGNFSVRGFKEGAHKFGAYVRDRWGNTSDTVWNTVTSLLEVELDRMKIHGLHLPGDMTSCCGSNLDVPLRNAYGPNGYAFYGVTNNNGEIDSLPRRVTYDMGSTVALSRFTYWMNQTFGTGSLRFFKIYGSMNPNPNGALDATWTQLGGTYELIKPSGLPYGQSNGADQTARANGSEFTFPLPAVPLRYFRIVVLKDFAGSEAMDLSSLKFMGSYQ